MQASQAALQQGIDSSISAVGQIAGMPELYKQDKSGGAPGDALAKFSQDTQGQRNLSMDIATDRPIPTPMPNITSLNADELYANPFLQQSANLGLTIPKQ